MDSIISLISLPILLLCLNACARASPVIKRTATPLCSESNSLERSSIRKWPRGLIPYTLSDYLPGPMRLKLMSTMHKWENSSCVLFVPRSSETDYVLFELGDKCCSNVGYLSQGKQEVLLNAPCTEPVAESKETLSDVIRLLVGDLNEGEIMNESMMQEDSSADSLRVKRLTSEGDRTPVNMDYVSRFNPECTETCGGCAFLNPSTNQIQKLLSTPHYPYNYRSLQDCVWKLIAPENYTVQMAFIDLEIEADSDCVYDFVSVLYLNSEGQVIRSRKLCGAIQVPETLDKDSLDYNISTIVIHFHSDDTYVEKGFLLGYWLQDKRVDIIDPCIDGNGECDHICTSDVFGEHTCSCREGYKLTGNGKTCIDIDECVSRRGGCDQKCRNSEGSFECDCRIGYALNFDQRTCRVCDSHYNESSGTIYSAGYPITYPHNRNCRWTLHHWPNHHLKITLHSLDIATSEKCTRDFLKLEHGHFPHQRRLCGYFNNIVFFVDKTTYLRFRTRTVNSSHSGFKLSYEQVLSSELSYFDQNYVTVEGQYVPYSKRIWV